MIQKHRKKRLKKVSGKTLAKALVLLALCVYVGFTLIKQQITLSNCSYMADEYKAKIAEAESENQRLETELERAGTDEYLERVAREELGLVKANERVFIDITQ